MSLQNQHIGIIGGGLIGMMSAFFLQKRGIRVTILERTRTGRESTWAGGGILSPLYPWKYADEINQLVQLSRILYPNVIKEIDEMSGLSSEYRVSGLLVSSSEMPEKAHQWCEQHDYKYQNCQTPKEIVYDAPFVIFPDVGQVRNPMLAASMAAGLHNMGVEIITECSVAEIIQGNTEGGVAVKSADKGVFHFDKVIIAAGAWSSALLESTGIKMPIKPIRGQMLLFKARPDWLRHILLLEGHYVIPRKDGRILVGSTMEDVGFDKSTTADAKEGLIQFIEKTIPGLLEFPIEKHWAGLRPGSPNGIPVISQHPQWENIYINAGHFRNGVILAPASAHLLTAQIMGESSNINHADYSANRCAAIEEAVFF